MLVAALGVVAYKAHLKKKEQEDANENNGYYEDEMEDGI